MSKREADAIIPSPFPPDVFYVWGETGMPISPLSARERDLLSSGASEKRVRDFTLGRHCARIALRGLMEMHQSGEVDGAGGEDRTEQSGLPEILRSPGRAPLWPAGLLGSITHAGNYAAAAVARAEKYYGIGLDLERQREGMPRLAARILRPEENERLRAVQGTEQHRWLTTIFSAKESIYKALNPATGVYLGFQDASVELPDHGNSDQGGFRWRLHKDCAPGLKSGFEGRGRYARWYNLVLTAVWVSTEEIN